MIPTIILKSKNAHENKITNQIDLFKIEETHDNFIEKSEDWKFDERLSKEFESLGFFISDHPLNEFTDILDNYEIISFLDYSNDKNKKEANIAATILKIQEKKTQKGNSYAIVKFSDRNSVFELFIFSDLLEINRDYLKEGESLIITINKGLVEENNRFKKFNIKKIAPIKNLINKPITNVIISVENDESLKKIESILNKTGNTNVKIRFILEKKELVFNLKNKRFFDRSHINLLKNQGIITNIL